MTLAEASSDRLCIPGQQHLTRASATCFPVPERKIEGRMNTFVVLLLMSCAPGVDSVPTAESMSSSNSGKSGRSERSSGSRPRLFGRMQGFFSRRSRGSDQSSPQSFPASQNGVAEVGPVNGTVPTPGPMVPPSISSGPITPSIIRPEPVTSPSGMTGPQRMPIGEPLPRKSTGGPF
jgi:hypothetical protein